MDWNNDVGDMIAENYDTEGSARTLRCSPTFVEFQDVDCGLFNRIKELADSPEPGTSNQLTSEDSDRERADDAAVDRKGKKGRNINNKKLDRLRGEQVQVLIQEFEMNNRLNGKRKLELAQRLELHPRQIQVWFQNKRAKLRVKDTHKQYEKLQKTYEDQKIAIRRLELANAELKARTALLQSQAHSSHSQVGAPGANNTRRPLHQAFALPAEADHSFNNMDNMDSLHSELIMTSADGRFCRPSASFVDMLGYTVDEMRNMDMQSITFAEDRTNEVIEQVMSGIVLKVTMRLRLRTRDNSIIWTQMNAYSLCDSQGNYYFVAYVSRLPPVDQATDRGSISPSFYPTQAG
mmetsp:Transcript_26106/g.42775  ORF Transcript_26106/g.42775 Transcript_26106/m.42775 type:complete len:349 (+) Transcript_26106:397-1443(+)|eukprot:CAMPEP_0184675812 /NCGR_PEP_ID=MMETSP0308-20130426/88006_1 /TAXON_ID=38269 /ORGANISM="Gloeochaete witrockiana, Strain SAG 46.84" /LENGTH=348 /DNA_ID=CAMNT_0027123579 /DNA_START=331 /DNA_END=1377 /DNA_ORIENTATION=-